MDDKERWKKEADLLKSDLSKREKVVKKNEVQIRFPSKNPKSPASSGNVSSSEGGDEEVRKRYASPRECKQLRM